MPQFRVYENLLDCKGIRKAQMTDGGFQSFARLAHRHGSASARQSHTQARTSATVKGTRWNRIGLGPKFVKSTLWARMGAEQFFYQTCIITGSLAWLVLQCRRARVRGKLCDNVCLIWIPLESIMHLLQQGQPSAQTGETHYWYILANCVQ